jgi:hypothetical protein
MKQFYENAQKTIRQFLLFVLLSFLSYVSAYVQAQTNPTHFTTVWQGENGQNHMNFIVISAILEDIPLASGDEIAVFDGSSCVGSEVLLQPINRVNSSTFSSIKASQDDGSANGFNDNNTIIFKLWDSKNQKEMLAKAVIYRTDMPTWITNGKYAAGVTAVVEIVSYTEYTQTIPLIKGTNLFSSYVLPSNPSFSIIMKPLCDKGALPKVTDESGKIFSYNTSTKSWVNNIGSLTKTEGYSISVNFNSTLELTGRIVALPLDIPLKLGMNFISFPYLTQVNAMSVIQSLITQNKLVKVQDEQGHTLEKIRSVWKNSIGNFVPGKSYKISVSAACTLTIQASYLKSAVNLAQPDKTRYFMTSYEGNGSDHMNINLIGIKESRFSVGDELAAFDGNICVGSLKLNEDHFSKDMAILVTSFNEDFTNQDGFTEGNPIQVYSWNKLTGIRSAVMTDVIDGEMKYQKNASVLVQLKSLSTGIKSMNNSISFDVFPNPAKNTVIVRFSNMPETGSTIEILDISGRIIASRVVHGISEEFNVENQAAGLYMVKSNLGAEVIIQKLFITK